MAHKYTSAQPQPQQTEAPITMPHLLKGRGPGFGLSVQRREESRLPEAPGWGLQASPFEKRNWWDPPAEPVAAEPVVTQPLAGPTILQRLAERPVPEGQEEQELGPEFDWQRQQIEAPRSIRRRAEVGAAGGDVSGDVEQRIQRSRGQGQEIAAPMREKYEQAFGRDFGGVRIHANTEADQLNRAVQAKAFTTGNDIYFKQGEYRPESRGGQALLAHELTHVVQQSVKIPRKENLSRQIIQRSETLEKAKHGLKSGIAFLDGICSGLYAELDSEDILNLSKKFAESYAINLFFPQVFTAGGVVGVFNDVASSIEGIKEVYENFSEILEITKETVRIILSPQGAGIARRIGLLAGSSYSKEIKGAIQLSAVEFTYELGKLIGPAIFYAVLTYITAGAGGALAIAGRSANLGTKIAKILKSTFKKFPKLKRLQKKIKSRKRRPKSNDSDQWFDNEGNPKWPPNGGFDGAPVKKSLKPGTRIDRYGYDGGKYVSPEGVPYSKRSLAPGSDKKPYVVFEVIKHVEVDAGKAAPWFGEPGGGIQYIFKKDISTLIKEGIIRRVKH